MSQSPWPEEGRPDSGNRAGRRPPDDWGDQPPPPPSGMSGGMKACLIIGSVFGLCCLLCCGVFGFLFYQMVPKVTNNAAAINAYRDQIAKIDLPASLEPKTGGKTENFMVSMIFVFYENPGHAQLMMGQFKSKLPGGEQMQMSMRQQFELQRNTEFHDMANEKTETRKLKIKGQEYSFIFATGEENGAGPGRMGRRRVGQLGGEKKKEADKKEADKKEDDKKEADKKETEKKETDKPNATEKKEGDQPEKKKIRHRITGEFEGKDGLAVIVIDFDDTYKEADIVKMIENIQ
jgi:hypothetical protein